MRSVGPRRRVREAGGSLGPALVTGKGSQDDGEHGEQQEQEEDAEDKRDGAGQVVVNRSTRLLSKLGAGQVLVLVQAFVVRVPHPETNIWTGVLK